MDKLVFNCFYQGGASLLDQDICPLELNGEPLQFTESRLVTDVTEPRPWWLLLIFIALMLATNKQRV